MTHFSRISKAVIDVPPAVHDRELEFWQAASGTSLAPSRESPQYHGAALRSGFELLVQRLQDGDPRVHLDIHTDDVAAEVARLEGLGARRLREIDGLWIMQDPAGLPFCVIARPPETFDENTARRWE